MYASRQDSDSPSIHEALQYHQGFENVRPCDGHHVFRRDSGRDHLVSNTSGFRSVCARDDRQACGLRRNVYHQGMR